MEITWLGHSCFRLKGNDLTIVTDPFDDSLGYRPGNLRADVVTVSHEGPHHSYLERVQAARKLLRGPGEYEVSGAFILGIKTFRDGKKGTARGANTVYRINIDNVVVCHLGELGHVPTSGHVSAIGDVHVLLVPVGGGDTLDAALATETVSLLQPRIVIPTHYKTDVAIGTLESVEPFLKEMGVKEAAPQPRLNAVASTLPSAPQVVLLEYGQPLA